MMRVRVGPAHRAAAVAQTAWPSKSLSFPPAIKSAQAAQLVDINSASAQELDKPSGIGPVRVKAIIANRPDNGKDDLVQRKIIPPNVYNQIKDKIIAQQK